MVFKNKKWSSHCEKTTQNQAIRDLALNRETVDWIENWEVPISVSSSSPLVVSRRNGLLERAILCRSISHSVIVTLVTPVVPTMVNNQRIIRSRSRSAKVEYIAGGKVIPVECIECSWSRGSIFLATKVDLNIGRVSCDCIG